MIELALYLLLGAVLASLLSLRKIPYSIRVQHGDIFLLVALGYPILITLLVIFGLLALPTILLKKWVRYLNDK